jgi:hypothetical protein
MKTIWLCAALYLLTAPVWASTANMDGNDILRTCQLGIDSKASEMTTAELMHYMHCLGYIDGVVDMLALGTTFPPDTHIGQICTPEHGMQSQQIVRIVLKYLKENPEKLHERGDLLIAWAMQHAFPCK